MKGHPEVVDYLNFLLRGELVVALAGRLWPAGFDALEAALIGGGVMYDQLAGRYAADTGEVRRIVLEDGSSVTLNTDSVIRVRYEAGQRRVDLGHGEASFAVAHDASRPFVVRAGDLRVRAVGTEFVVRLQGEQVSVTVAEGVVEVKRPTPGPDARRLIYEHDQIVAAGPAPLTATNIGQDEVARQLAWRDGLLVFDGEALSEIWSISSLSMIFTRALSPVSKLSVWIPACCSAFSSTQRIERSSSMIQTRLGCRIAVVQR